MSFAIAPAALAQTMTNRWSFNSGASANGTVLPDSIAGASGTIVGIGASRSGPTLTLPGSTTGNQPSGSISAYFDLPNGIISSKTHMTVELWASVVSSKAWQRLFDFGRVDIAANGGGQISNTAGTAPGATSSSDNLMLAIQRGTSLTQQRIAARINGGGEQASDNSLPLVLGTQYHFALTFQSGVGANAATGGRITWYRDGVLVATVDTNFRLNQIEDVNNWLGRSQFSGDSNSNIAYDEFRLYSSALSQTDIVASRKAGTNAAIIPTTVADTITLQAGKKAAIPVLSNDTGQAFPSTVEIVTPPANGTASVMPDGRILYTHVNTAATTDTLSYRVRGGGGLSNTSSVSITIQEGIKITNPGINVPANPPTSSIGLVNAFPAINDNGGLAFDSPLGLTSPPGDTKRLFVVGKNGVIWLVPDVTSPNPTSIEFFNLAGLVNPRTTEDIFTNGESGLLSIAFHPQYATNRQFYVFYSVSIGGLPYQRVSRFLTQAGNPAAADTTTEQILIQQRDEQTNHNGGDMHFGPEDGFLYISVGDEGSGDDNPTYNSQRINKDFFSGILRIDVDKDPVKSIPPTTHTSIPAGGPNYFVPRTNPYVLPADGGDWNGYYYDQAYGPPVSGTIRREFWATGLRNPWRMSFDPVTHVLWCADVGQGQREEVNKIVRGGNYGWVFREGTLQRSTSENLNYPTQPTNFETFHKPPVYEYGRTGTLGGNSVTGGRVYRGNTIPSLTGKYIFGDYGSGNIWSLNLDGTGVTRIAGEGGIAGFGYDPSNGDILLADIDNARILRLANTITSTTYPATLSATGLFADLTDLTPSPGVVPYTVNLPFWSDHAVKNRWVVVPDGNSRFTTSPEGLWTLPTGTIWVKHFEMEMQRGIPSSRKRLETRLIVKNSTGAYGVSYRWNDAGTEAFLVGDGGDNFVLNVTDNGNPVPQTWRIPSRAECLICHTPQAGHALSFNTRQLNLEHEILGISGNQLVTLRDQNYFTNDPGSPNLLPHHSPPDDESTSVEARVRSYIAVNCSYCHKDGGSAPSSWNGSPDIALEQTGLINGMAANSGTDPLNRLVVPGDTLHSIVLNRVAATNGFTRMPPLASNVIDQANVELLTTWINGGLATRQTYPAWRIARFEPDDDPSGDPAFDADGDGLSNRAEFLLGTDPLNAMSFSGPVLAANEEGHTLGFSVPTNRSFTIETSSDLGNWTPWDIPGNAGTPAAGGPLQFPVETTGTHRFFRLKVREN